MRNRDPGNLLKIKKLLMSIGTLFAFLVTVELCARIDDYLRYDAPLLGKYSVDTLRSSEEGIPFNVPLASFEKWHNNSYGFRGREVSLAKGDGKTRVVCLGASESYGLYESAGREWPAQLQQFLADSGYEVINASVAGLSLKKYSQYFSTYVAPFRPDVVVLVVNPLFYVTALERNRPAGKTDAPTALVSAKKTALSPAPKVPELRFLPKAKQALKKGLASTFPAVLRRWELHALQEQVRQIELQRLKGHRAKDAVSYSHLVSFHNDLAETVAAVQSHGSRVVLTTYPTLIDRNNLDQYPEIFLDNRRFCIELSLRGMIDAFEKFNAVIAAVAEEEGAVLVDSYTLIPKSTEYFGDNVHYKDKGASLFAQGVAAVLSRGPAAASLPRPGSRQ